MNGNCAVVSRAEAYAASSDYGLVRTFGDIDMATAEYSDRTIEVIREDYVASEKGWVTEFRWMQSIPVCAVSTRAWNELTRLYRAIFRSVQVYFTLSRTLQIHAFGVLTFQHSPIFLHMQKNGFVLIAVLR